MSNLLGGPVLTPKKTANSDPFLTENLRTNIHSMFGNILNFLRKRGEVQPTGQHPCHVCFIVKKSIYMWIKIIFPCSRFLNGFRWRNGFNTLSVCELHRRRSACLWFSFGLFQKIEINTRCSPEIVISVVFIYLDFAN